MGFYSIRKQIYFHHDIGKVIHLKHAVFKFTALNISAQLQTVMRSYTNRTIGQIIFYKHSEVNLLLILIAARKLLLLGSLSESSLV